MYRRVILLGVILFIFSCNVDDSQQFTLLDSKKTGIKFNNVIDDQGELNILNFEYIYNGGGVAIGDLNNDNLQDIVFTANMTDNAIYLNKGKFVFEDISEPSGILNEKRWNTGITLVDINADGKLDIYICASGHKGLQDKTNLLYINQGNNAKGIPTFKEMAAQYGVDDASNSTMAAFFDYDNDGDLDLFVVANVMPDNRAPSRYRKKVIDGSSDTDDHLYRNDWNEETGHPVYTEVSHEAGILIEGFSLGLNICDLNEDGWKDIYITNDYLSNDLLYINNQDGTFTDKADEYFKHTSFSAMGNDVIDLDNDGHPEVVALDMLPEDNYRKKTMLPPNNYTDHINNERYNFQYQFVRNTLQKNNLHNAHNTEGAIFSDVAIMSGIAATDWSWTPLIADFDNDSDRDIIITNGFPKDVTDRDFVDYSNEVKRLASPRLMLNQAPSAKLKNYAYCNNANLQFENVSDNWGIDIESFSNGAAYGDLDGDGDLDYVVNNINDEAFIYRNNSTNTNWVRIKLNGTEKNSLGLGSLIHLYYNNEQSQHLDFTLGRGYRSSQEPYAHFGLGNHTKVDSIIVEWPDHSISKITDLTANTIIEINHDQATRPKTKDLPHSSQTLVNEVAKELNLNILHEEDDYTDFNVQPLLIHKLSQYGPAISVGDVNNDGLEDLFISGSHFYQGTVMTQNADGTFSNSQVIDYEESVDTLAEELGALFFDADGDGDDDLYVTHGGYEFEGQHEQYIDALYINKDGQLEKDNAALPQTRASTICVRAHDYDKDGDLDLFVGSRVAPYNYPKAVSGQILRNDSKAGKVLFTDVTEEVAAPLLEFGMITDALWSDYDNDGNTDLIITGEFTPVTFLKNNNGKFENAIAQSNLSEYVGWWNSITAGDYDNDGDIDYVAGNYGENFLSSYSQNHPIKVYYKDIDNNGTPDFIPTYFYPDPEGNYQEYSYFGSTDVAKQVNSIKKKYKFHKEFAIAPMEEFLTPEELKGAYQLEASYFKSSYIENQGDGQFLIQELPQEVQVAPVYGMQSMDINNDGNLDLIMVGNDYGSEVKLGRLDALDGIVGIGNGQGEFEFIPAHESGFLVQEDAKGLAVLYNTHLEKNIIIASQNRGPLRVFAGSDRTQVIDIMKDETYAVIKYINGQERKDEFYYGSGFVSQSSRRLMWNSLYETIEIYNNKGESRSISY